jgi:hypothetical protein
MTAFTVAQSPPSSVFVYNTGFLGSNFTFAINLANTSQDLFFHLNGPSQFSWIAVGTGSEMKNSLMFIAYPSSDGKSTFIDCLLGFSILTCTSRRDIEPQNGLVSKLCRSGDPVLTPS